MLTFAVISCLLVLSADASNLAVPATSSSGKYKSSVLKFRGGSSSELSSFDWRFFVAGGICAACSHGMTTPIDVVKTKMQTEPEKYTKGVMSAAKDIVAKEGAMFLLSGLGPTVVGYGFEGALKFGFYETFKGLFKTLTPSKVTNLLLASVVAGGIASIVLCPMEEARIKMVGDETWAKENVVTGITRLVRENGLLSTFGGLPAMLAKQVPYTMSKQVSFDLVATILYSIAADANLAKADVKWVISLASAFIASILACLSSQPGDMILTATYRSKTGGGIGEIISEIYKKHGLSGFFIGVQARMAHIITIITSQLVMYDIIKIALKLPPSGSH